MDCKDEVLVGSELIDFLNKQEWSELLLRLEAFAANKINGLKKYSSVKSPFDLVSEIIEKVFEGKRKVYRKDLSNFKVVLFGMLKSHIDNYLNSSELKILKSTVSVDRKDDDFNQKISELSSSEILIDETLDIDLRKSEILKRFKSLKPEEIEVDILECWIDKLINRKEVSELLNITASEYDKHRKKVVRKLDKI